MTIDRAAADGYQVAADAYDRGRPGYPQAAIDRLVSELRIDSGSQVVDLGAGTGQMTAALSHYAAGILAVEPVESMRRKLRALHPNIPVVAGTAESIPLADQSADVIVCAQAFHWFDGFKALAEIGRVLTPAGRLGLIWNVRDESCEWVARLTKIIDPYAGDTPRFRRGRWREVFEATDRFTPLKHASVVHHHTGPPSLVVDRIMSISFIAALPQQERRGVEKALNDLLQNHSELRGRDRIDFPYETVIYWCSRVEGA